MAEPSRRKRVADSAAPIGDDRDSLGRGLDDRNVSGAVSADPDVRRERQGQGVYLQAAYKDPRGDKARLAGLVACDGHVSASPRLSSDPEQCRAVAEVGGRWARCGQGSGLRPRRLRSSPRYSGVSFGARMSPELPREDRRERRAPSHIGNTHPLTLSVIGREDAAALAARRCCRHVPAGLCELGPEMSQASLRKLFERQRLRRAESRGDVVSDRTGDLRLILELGEALIPDAAREIPRDLFGLLAFSWAVHAGEAQIGDAHALLKEVRRRAWLGYSDPDALIALVRSDLPRSDVSRRMVAYFGELAAKRSTYMFLPVVSRIDHHQSATSAAALGSLRLDGITGRWGDTALSEFAAMSFALAPELTRERDALYLALLTGRWGRVGLVTGTELSSQAAGQLRRLFEAPDEALAETRESFSELGPSSELAHALVEIGEEVSARAPWLWLETLFIVENWITGPRWFDHAFEVQTISPEAWSGSSADGARSGTSGSVRS